MSFLSSLFSSAKEEKKPPKVTFNKVKGGGNIPVGDWKRESNLLDVQGIQYRRDAAVKFAKLVVSANRKDEYYGLVLEREPTNIHDANAVKVIGSCAGQELHIGYLDRHEAEYATQHYPAATLAAEFYDLYLSANNYVAIRFFVLVPKATVAKPGDRGRKLLDFIGDELTILNHVIMANGKRTRAESDLLHKYLVARADDFHFPIYEDDLKEILRWLKSLVSTEDDVAIAIERIAHSGTISIRELSDLIQIFIGINGKVNAAERAAMEFVSAQLAHTTDLPKMN